MRPHHGLQTTPRLFSTQIVLGAEAVKPEDVAAAAAPGQAVQGASDAAANATEAASLDGKVELLLDAIPEKPLPLAEAAASLGDPSLESLGLCSYWPPGRIQWLLETMHVDFGVPWWGSVMLRKPKMLDLVSAS